jgi:hypothetical protein
MVADAWMRGGAEMDFWELLVFVLITVPLVLLWGFALYDIFRRHDLGGWAKALWLVVVLLFPWFGTLIYVIMRPKGMALALAMSMEDQPAGPPPAAAAPPVGPDPVAQLTALGDLHTKGLLTDDEFQQQKARILAAASAASTAATALPTVSVPTVALPTVALPPMEPPTDRSADSPAPS